MSKIILDLCGGTGSWSKPYKDAGYDVRLITLPENDVLTYKPPENVYGILAAPPCDNFAVSGARWFKEKDKDGRTAHSVAILMACMDIIQKSNPVFWCLENPVGRIIHWIGKPHIYFNPCDYGDPWTKKTGLWGKFNIPKKNPVEAKNNFLPHKILSKTVSQNQINKLIDAKYLPKNYKEIYGDLKDRKTIRAITPPGFAKAFFEANK